MKWEWILVLCLQSCYAGDSEDEEKYISSLCGVSGSSSRIDPTYRARTESNDSRLMTQQIMQNFFSEDPVLGSLIIPYFEKRLQQERHSPSLDQKERASNLKRALSCNDIKKEDAEYINQLMNDVLKEALINKHNELSALNAHPQRPWTNRRMALCSAGTAIVTVLISSAVTMAIAFSEC